MATATSIGFALAGAALLVVLRAARAPHLALAGRGLSLAVAAIGGVGLHGYIIHLELLYSWSAYSMAALHTAAGFVILGVGLWLAAGRAQSWPAARQITTTAMTLLLLTGVTIGLVGFAIMERHVAWV